MRLQVVAKPHPIRNPIIKMSFGVTSSGSCGYATDEVANSAVLVEFPNESSQEAYTSF